MTASTLLAAIGIGWGLASPLPSGPDEVAHVTKAAAVVRGTLIGAPMPRDGHHHSKASVVVQVPATIAAVAQRGTCDYNVGRSAACDVVVRGSSRLVPAVTYVGRYPPLYYALTGLPLLVSSATWTLLVMRIIDAVVVGGLLGLAFAVTATWGTGLRLLALGVVVTPTVLYLGGIVNPSGLEVGGAVALWAALAVLVFDRPDDPPLGAVVTAVAGSVALSASRSLSTLFWAVIVSAVVVVRPKECRQLWARRRIRTGAAIALGSTVASGAYVIVARSYEVEAFPLRHPSTGQLALRIIGRTPALIDQLIGAFGSPNFGVPSPVLAGWSGVVIALLLAAMTVAPRRDAVALALVVVGAGLLVPFAVVATHVRVDGIAWQGRYSLPLVAGVPVLASGIVGARPGLLPRAALSRLAAFISVGLVVGWVTAFYWFLRRYTVSLGVGHLNAFATTGAHWVPTLGAPLLFALVTACSVAFGVWIGHQASRARAPGGAVDGGVIDLDVLTTPRPPAVRASSGYRSTHDA